MREAEVPVVFLPSGKTVYVLGGTRLIEAAAGAGLALDLPCGGEGVCGKCRVVVRRGACEPGPVERETFTPEDLGRGLRLACQTTVCGPATVEVALDLGEVWLEGPAEEVFRGTWMAR